MLFVVVCCCWLLLFVVVLEQLGNPIESAWFYYLAFTIWFYLVGGALIASDPECLKEVAF